MTFVAAAVGGLAGYGIAGTLAGAAIGAGIGGTIGGSMNQASAAKQAAATQLQGTQYAANIQKEMFDVLNEQQKPYREAGYGALEKLTSLRDMLTSPVSAQEIQNLPGFDFAINQGIGAARQNVNVGGGGSNVDRAAQKFASDYVTSTAMPQVLAQRQNIYNTLAGIAGLGQTAQGQVSTASQNTSNALAQLAVGGATAAAGGQVGAANAMASGVSNLGNAGMMYALLKG